MATTATITPADLTRMVGEAPDRESAVTAWANGYVHTRWTPEEAEELVALWHADTAYLESLGLHGI
jgi:hypothetical protein